MREYLHIKYFSLSISFEIFWPQKILPPISAYKIYKYELSVEYHFVYSFPSSKFFPSIFPFFVFISYFLVSSSVLWKTIQKTKPTCFLSFNVTGTKFARRIHTPSQRWTIVSSKSNSLFLQIFTFKTFLTWTWCEKYSQKNRFLLFFFQLLHFHNSLENLRDHFLLHCLFNTGKQPEFFHNFFPLSFILFFSLCRIKYSHFVNDISTGYRMFF